MCLSRAPQFVAARAWACYPRDEIEEHPLRQVVQKFKYGRRVSLGKPLGRVTEHGSELETVERLAVKSDALVAEEKQVEALVRALTAILAAYQQFLAFAADL